MKQFILGVVAIVILISLLIVVYQLGKNSASNNSAPLSPLSSSTPTASRAPIATTSQPVVGNDADEHGCRLSAGYSWCESKQKCYRHFEEGCPNIDDPLIKTALYTKNKWPQSETITITVSTNDGKYASGTVNGQGGGGYFYAAKVNGNWEIVADGNGIIPCSSLTTYPDYPKTLISSCYDDKTDKLIKR